MEQQSSHDGNGLWQFMSQLGLYPRDTLEVVLAVLAFIGLILLVVHHIYKKKSGNEYEESKAFGLLRFSPHIFPFFFGLLILRSFVLEPYEITTDSMAPTLREGDLILLSKFSYHFKIPLTNTVFWDIGNPQRGDIVVFRRPNSPDKNEVFRIVGLPGEHIRYNRKTGQIFINNNPIPQAHVNFQVDLENKKLSVKQEEMNEKIVLIVKNNKKLSPLGVWLPDEGKIIPEGQYFGLIDVRDECCDSRETGVINKVDIVGKAYAILMTSHKGVGFHRARILD